MIKVKDLRNGALPAEFLETLPDTCPSCGADTEITEALTLLRCSNMKCPEKGVQRLATMVKDLGILSLGESKCRSFMQHFDCYNPYCLFGYESDKDGPLFDGCSQAFSDAVAEQVDAHRSMTLWEYVKYANIPGIRDSARLLLTGYSDLESFYEDLESGGVDFVQQKLGIKGGTAGGIDYVANGEDTSDDVVSVRAVSIYENLILFKEELFEFIDYVDIKQVNRVYNVCISRAVGEPFKSKADFVDCINNKLGTDAHINYLSSVSKNCDYLVWSGIGAETDKVKKARKLIADGACDIKIVTGQELIDIVTKEE